MSSYIGAVQVDSGDQILIGSTLFGTCSTAVGTAAKAVTLASFDSLINGVTVFVKFVNGNSVTSGMTLAVGTTTATAVTGNCVCEANEVIAFTYENDGTNQYWRPNHSLKIETSNNIVTKLSGQEVNLATQTYVDNKTAGLSGLTGAMHFKGTVNSLPTATDPQTFSDYDAGDVILYNDKEYVYNKGISAAASEWVELGDESSYVLKTSQTTDSVGSASGWSAGSTPTLGTAIDADDITNWDAGSASSATVSGGVLHITNSTVPTLSYTARSVPNVTDVGSTPSLTIGSKTVVVPAGT